MSIITPLGRTAGCLPVYLTVDVGPANAIMGDGHVRAPSWEMTFKGLDALRKAIPLLEERTQRSIPITWFVRADRFVEQQFGDCLAVVNRFMDKMDGLMVGGHELGWMPQLPSGGTDKIQHEDLEAGYQRFREILPNLKSVRMGDCYHDNDSMQLLNMLGIRFDSSALPGREKHDGGWCMDWRKSPQFAYYPSCNDYSVPGSPQMTILEIPLSVAPILAPYDSKPLLRYVNPCYLENIWDAGLSELISTAPYLVCILHPDELVERATPGHPLIAYSCDTFISNIIRFLSRSAGFGRAVCFHAIRDFNSVSRVGEPFLELGHSLSNKKVKSDVTPFL